MTAALFYKIPVAHLHGGEITEGAYDDAIRHAITKMSHLHFTSTEAYRQRIIQLGEQPERVFNVGAIGIDNIRHMKLLDRETLEKQLNFSFGEKSVLVTYHPETLENIPVEVQFRNLLAALDQYKDLKILFTLPNSDTGGRVIIQMTEDFIHQHPGTGHSLSFFRSIAIFVGITIYYSCCRKFFQWYSGGTFVR